jgi:hypothetical protein
VRDRGKGKQLRERISGNFFPPSLSNRVKGGYR